MSSFRKDPFGRAWVLMSPDRGLRPSDFGSVPRVPEPSPLVPGNEAALPNELQAIRPSASAANGPGWRARALPMPGTPLQGRRGEVEAGPLYRTVRASGHVELVVEHPEPAMTLETMPRDHLVEVLRLYRDRLAFASSRPDVRHVQLTRSVGRAAGALYDHPHGQVMALPVPNRWMEEEATAAAEHHARYGRCLFCEVLAFELRARERVVTANEAFVAVAPWAAKTPFETWILPREHASAFTTTAVNRLPQLGEILQSVLRAFADALDRPPYNMIVHTSPRGDDDAFHWHIELLPRLTRQAGFDWGTGSYVNPTPPEDATRFLREAMAVAEVAG